MRIEQLQNHLNEIKAQRELAFVNLHRLDGAIALLELLLKESAEAGKNNDAVPTDVAKQFEHADNASPE